MAALCQPVSLPVLSRPSVREVTVSARGVSITDNFLFWIAGLLYIKATHRSTTRQDSPRVRRRYGLFADGCDFLTSVIPPAYDSGRSYRWIVSKRRLVASLLS